VKNEINIIPAIILIAVSFLILTGFPKETVSVTTEDESTIKQRKTAVNPTIAEYEPALAVRASGCITCHAKINSSYITDFGHGSPYFFGNPGSGNKVGPFNGNIYGDFIAGTDKTSWLTAEFHKEIIVPRSDLEFDMRDAAETILADQSLYPDAFQAASLAEYLKALENQKPNPAQVIEKKRVYIGAPDAATLEARFGIKPGSAVDFKYIKSDRNVSPDIEGIKLSKNRDYYTNSSDVVCDGDFFVRGILFLNKPTIVTDSGCRIYATDPIFLQGELKLKGKGKNASRANLQLVSTEAIFLGVGRKKCGTTTDSDPLSLRLIKTPALPSIITRSAVRDNIPPQTFAQNIYNKAKLVPLEDSSCHDENLSLSRILLNAPLVHSRYSGKFKGLVIAEFALFWQGKSDFEFDPVFKKVPVLPLLKDEDYLLTD
jgi:hypothetical protein